jgi:hypothetical protein
VLWFERDGFQNQKIERPLREFHSRYGHSVPFHFDRKGNACRVEAQGEELTEAALCVETAGVIAVRFDAVLGCGAYSVAIVACSRACVQNRNGDCLDAPEAHNDRPFITTTILQ